MKENYGMKEIGGYSYQKIEAEKIIHFFKNYDAFTKAGATLPKGIVFYGEPGNGKTKFAYSIVKDSGVNAFSLSDSTYVTNYNSLGKEIKELFRKAKENAPSIIVLDEIDQLIDCEKSLLSQSSESEKEVLRILLTEIDGIDDKGVLVIATGNVDIENLPSALVRNGRIEKHIHIGDPDYKDREDILKMFLSTNEVFNKINCGELANITNGLTCASLKTLVNDVLIKCISENKDATYEDFHDPLQVIVSHGIKRKDLPSNNSIIYHEVGHLVVDYILNGNVGFISTESYGLSEGRYKSIATKNESGEMVDSNFCKTLDDFIKVATVCAAGLASTEIFLGKKHVGAVQDLNEITSIYQTISRHGLVDFETFTESDIGNSPFPTKKFESKEYKKKLVEFMNNVYEEAKIILSSNTHIVKTFYETLKEKRSLTSTEVKKMMEFCSENAEELMKKYNVVL